MSPDTPDIPFDAARADAVIAEYLRRVDRGEQVSQADFVREHPEFAEQLEAFFTAAELFESMAGPTRAEAERGLDELTDDDEVVLLEAASIRYVDRYQVLHKIGQGAMGEVFLAYDTQLDRQVALKLPTLPSDESEPMLERFYREARAAAGLQHPNICPIFDIGCDRDQHFISMAYIEGGTLADRLAAGNGYSPYQATSIVRKLALALQHAHQAGVIHRDLKPSNVLLNAAGEPVITDFGLARRLFADDVRVTQTGAILGSPAYLAPEQIAPDALPDFDTAGETVSELEPFGATNGPPALSGDIYGLGVIYYELLTGRVPFTGSVATVLLKIVSESPRPPDQVHPEVDATCSAICMKMLAKHPADRYPSMAAVAAALDEALVPPAARSNAAAAAMPAFPAAANVPAAEPKPDSAWDEPSDPDRVLRNSLLGIGAGLLFVGAMFLLLGIYFWRDVADNDSTMPPRPSTAGFDQQTQKGTPREPSLETLQLAYKFEPSGVYPFEVEVIAELPESNLVMRGTPAFTVRESDELGTSLELRGGLIPHDEPRDPLRWNPLSMSPFRTYSSYGGLLGGMPSEHVLTVGSRGQLKSVRGNSQLPFLLGNLSQLLLDELPDPGQQSWTIQQTAPPDTTPTPRHPLYLAPHFRSGRTPVVAAQRNIQYVVKSHDTATGRVVLTKTIEATATRDGYRYSFQGEGEVLFDTREGLPIKMTLRGVSRNSEFTHPTKINITTKRMDRAEYERRMAEAARRAEEAKVAREKAEAEARLPVHAAEWTTLKQSLESADDEAVRTAAKRLKQTDELDATVVEEVRSVLLETLDRHSDHGTQREIVSAIGRYAQPSDVSPLIPLVAHADGPIRKTAIETLGRIGDARAAKAVATRLADGFERGMAAEALRRIGPAAEEATLPYLENRDRWIREAAIGVVTEIGTNKSLPALQMIADQDSDGGLRSAALKAIQAIELRSLQDE